MDALYFLKIWKSAVQYREHRRPSSVVDTYYYEFEEEEGDSFFELELTVPDIDNNKCIHSALDTDSNPFDNKVQNLHNTTGNSELKFQPQSVSLSPIDCESKRKILPVQSPTTSKPQSPISLLKSVPSFRVFMFKKSKSMVAHETEFKAGFVDNDNGRSKKQESKLFTVKFKLKEVANVPIFTRENSLRRQISQESLSEDSSKLFCKELLRKYLKLVKPLYIKISRKQREKPKFPGDLSAASPSSSPATDSPKKEKHGSIPAGIRVVCKHLGKSKSASASAASTAAPPSTVSRRDDSLLLQRDGIQSAILHCKNSFNSSSSRDSSL